MISIQMRMQDGQLLIKTRSPAENKTALQRVMFFTAYRTIMF